MYNKVFNKPLSQDATGVKKLPKFNNMDTVQDNLPIMHQAEDVYDIVMS